MAVIPYLIFPGTCADALAFYADAFHAEPQQVRTYEGYVPAGLAAVPENLSSWIMHAELGRHDVRLWLADDPSAVGAAGDVVRITLLEPDAESAAGLFHRLADGGEVVLPPTATFYSDFHGALRDRHGVHWHIISSAGG